MSSPDTRGWGPHCPRHEIITIHPAGLALQVHRRAAPLFERAINYCAAHGRRFDQRKDDWGYSCRKIRGSSTVWSNHSWGLAVDLDAMTNPMTEDGKIHTDMEPWVIEAFETFGFFWGGHYSGMRKDPMHFEILGTPRDVDRLVATTAGLIPGKDPKPIRRRIHDMFLVQHPSGLVEICSITDDNKISHVGIEDPEDRDRFLGSGAPLVEISDATWVKVKK